MELTEELTGVETEVRPALPVPAYKDRELSGRVLRVLLADAQPIWLVGVRAVLEADGRFDIVGETGSGARVVPMVGQVDPDVVVLDLDLPGLDGFGCLDRIGARHPDVRCVVLSASDDPDLIQEAFRRGARGFVVKAIDASDLPFAIRQAVDGTSYHALGAAARESAPAITTAGLTQRETEIVRLVARGLSNQAIGKQLWVSEQTVKFHLTKIFRKLGVTSRVEVARWVFQNGVGDDESSTETPPGPPAPRPRPLRA